MSDTRRLGDYRLVRVLGRGGMGEVWEAERQAPPGGTFAIKRIREGTADALQLRRLAEEAAISKDLVHPHIVRTLDVGLEGAECFVVMERLEAVSLSQVIALPGPLPLALVATLGAQLLEGVEYLRSGLRVDGRPFALVHRDLKPSNLLLTREGKLKIIDFGIARSDHMDMTRTQTGLVRGTLAYIAPELLGHARPDHRSDVYAVALILQELLTGERVFSAANEASLLAAILWSPIPPARQRRPDLPGSVDGVLRRAHARDPAERFATAAELAEAWKRTLLEVHPWSEAQVRDWLLDQDFPEETPQDSPFGDPRGITAQPPSTAPEPARMPAPEPRRRAVWPWSVAGLVAMLAAAGTFIVVNLGGRHPVNPSFEPPAVTAAPLTATLPGPPEPAKPASKEEVEVAPEAAETRPVPPNPSRRRTAKAAAPAAAGFLTVDSKESWAAIRVNGRKLGETPLVQAVIPSGRIKLDAERADGRKQTRMVVVRPHAETRILLTW